MEGLQEMKYPETPLHNPRYGEQTHNQPPIRKESHENRQTRSIPKI